MRREDPMHTALFHRRRPRLHGRAAASLACALATTQGCSDRSIAKDASESSDTSTSSEEGSSTAAAEQDLGECLHVLLYSDETCDEPWLIAVPCDADEDAPGPKQCVCEP